MHTGEGHRNEHFYGCPEYDIQPYDISSSHSGLIWPSFIPLLSLSYDLIKLVCLNLLHDASRNWGLWEVISLKEVIMLGPNEALTLTTLRRH